MEFGLVECDSDKNGEVQSDMGDVKEVLIEMLRDKDTISDSLKSELPRTEDSDHSVENSTLYK